ncbi:tail protein X [Chelatococcus sp.]|uniref:tail protein X n=1 Tax=Chelatococcus sp. TaxID=1953771 RepID=UPI001EB69343|nr:tail protein X [Chelatococcus sp.]MBX3545608.1 tail protein X [Chelatococcus sp.]
MVTRTYIPKEDLRLDILARDLLGTEQEGAVEMLVAANPGLAERSKGFATAGEALIVPEFSRKTVIDTVNPWE